MLPAGLATAAGDSADPIGLFQCRGAKLELRPLVRGQDLIRERRQGLKAQLAQRGMLGLGTEQGLALLGATLGGNGAMYMPCQVDWTRVVPSGTGRFAACLPADYQPTAAVSVEAALPLAPAHAQDADADTAHQVADEARAAGQTDADEDDGEDDGEEANAANDPANAAAGIFGEQPVDTAGFRQAVNRAYEDPLQRPVRQVTEWKPIDGTTAEKKAEKKDTKDDKAGQKHGERNRGLKLLARVAEWGLWALLGVVVLVLLLTARLWWPWLRGAGRRTPKDAPRVQEEAVELPVVLPPDVATQAGLLWDQGRPRQALALLYRASVRTLVERTGNVLPPGATEAQCLRASRRMPQQADRDLFARIVRMWQYAAYGGRLPTRDEFDGLAATLRQQFGWKA